MTHDLEMLLSSKTYVQDLHTSAGKLQGYERLAMPWKLRQFLVREFLSPYLHLNLLSRNFRHSLYYQENLPIRITGGWLCGSWTLLEVDEDGFYVRGNRLCTKRECNYLDSQFLNSPVIFFFVIKSIVTVITKRGKDFKWRRGLATLVASSFSWQSRTSFCRLLGFAYLLGRHKKN